MVDSTKLCLKLLSSYFKKVDPPTFYRAKVDSEWVFWRPIMEKVLTYSEASVMSPEELMEANAAIDSYIDRSKAQRGG